MIAPDVLQLDKRITVAVKNIEPERVGPVLTSVLRTVDVEMVTNDGILYVQKIKPPEEKPSQASAVAPTAIDAKAPGQKEDAKKIPDVIASYRPGAAPSNSWAKSPGGRRWHCRAEREG